MRGLQTMGKDKPIPPAPVVIPAGSTQWEEFIVRRTLPDGRIIDSEPMMLPVATAAAMMAPFLALPQGSTIEVLYREVTSHATAWMPYADRPADAPDPLLDALRRSPLSESVRVIGCAWCGTNGLDPRYHPGGQDDHVDPGSHDQHDFGQWPDTCILCNADRLDERHGQHGRAAFPATCIRCEAEAGADRQAATEHAHTLGMACPVGGCRWPADADTEDLSGQVPTKDLSDSAQRAVDPGPYAFSAGEGERRRLAGLRRAGPKGSGNHQ